MLFAGKAESCLKVASYMMCRGVRAVQLRELAFKVCKAVKELVIVIIAYNGGIVYVIPPVVFLYLCP